MFDSFDGVDGGMRSKSFANVMGASSSDAALTSASSVIVALFELPASVFVELIQEPACLDPRLRNLGILFLQIIADHAALARGPLAFLRNLDEVEIGEVCCFDSFSQKAFRLASFRSPGRRFRVHATLADYGRRHLNQWLWTTAAESQKVVRHRVTARHSKSLVLMLFFVSLTNHPTYRQFADCVLEKATARIV